MLVNLESAVALQRRRYGHTILVVRVLVCHHCYLILANVIRRARSKCSRFRLRVPISIFVIVREAEFALVRTLSHIFQRGSVLLFLVGLVVFFAAMWSSSDLTAPALLGDSVALQIPCLVHHELEVVVPINAH